MKRSILIGLCLIGLAIVEGCVKQPELSLIAPPPSAQPVA